MSDASFTHDVFLSHSAKDKAVVRAVAERLRKDGLKVWFDEWVLKPGDSIPAKIEEGLEHSRVLVLCMSANAFGSDWAQLEAGTFRFRDPLNQKRRFIPLRLDDTPIKGSLAQFLHINWRPADREQEYAKVLAACRGEIKLASTNEPSALTQPQANPVAPAKLVQIVHSGSGDIVMGNKSVGKQTTVFTPGPQHVTPETARQLSELVKEIVERLTVTGGNVQKAFQRVWGDFNRHFGLTTYRELPREKADEGISYLRQWRASKNSKLRFADPERFRTAQLKGIWPRSKALGFADADLYAFAASRLKLNSPISSLNELGNQQLAKLNRFLTYEERKLKKRSPAKLTTSETPSSPQSEQSQSDGTGRDKEVALVQIEPPDDSKDEGTASAKELGPAEAVLKAWADRLNAPIGLSIKGKEEKFYSYSTSSASPHFCHVNRQSEAALRACMNCDLAWFKVCETERKTQIYKCWAGLTDIAVPIFNANNLLGVVFTGQLRVDPTPPDPALQDSLKKLGISGNWLQTLSEVRVSDQAEFDELVKAAEDLARELALALTAPSHICTRENIECIKELTPELICFLKRHEHEISKLPWDVFEHLIAEFFASWGFSKVRLVGRSKRTAADVFAVERPSATGVALRYFIEVKKCKERVGLEVIDRVLGAVARERPQWGWHVAMICSATEFTELQNTTPERLRLQGLEIRGRKDILQWLRDYRLTDRGLWLPKEIALEPVTPPALAQGQSPETDRKHP